MTATTADADSFANGLDKGVHPATIIAFLFAITGGLIYAGISVFNDTQQVGEQLALGAFLFLGLALLIALGFEFVNGFHDTANAVATVIYTNSMPPLAAVIWSGAFNFLGVLTSTGAVAYSIITLLPVDLILQVGSASGFAMIFALLIAAVAWNLGTWYFGIPNSSSHALIGSIMGVGIANQLMSSGASGTSGVDWGQAQSVLAALLFSPLLGFIGAMLLIYAMRLFIRNKAMFEEPKEGAPPPGPIRALLIFTCTAVSFAHGGNDGQKGMGLIMLILIGVAPTAYALNRTMPDSATPAFVQSAEAARNVFQIHAGGVVAANPELARETLRDGLRHRAVDKPAVYGALATLSGDIDTRLTGYGSLARVPAAATANLRNDMYLTQDTLNLLTKDGEKAARRFPGGQDKILVDYRKQLESSTRFIPTWVKVAVALALGLGTMVGWKRIVVTVGQRIGKRHMSYAMGAAAELMAASTILLAQVKGLPVSTTHILSSGVAGAAVGNPAGLQAGTIRRIALTWVTTLPAAIVLSGSLYALFLGAVHAFGMK
ncbi:MAG: anion permease [Sphingomonas sanxanigenens]|uniref:Phosphate transporter n=1 Tax=Sphingomonas sanxanigenens TaxID=397260 RepID=A0A2W5A9J2_9SPHN|nr:MAG: anion permease [Sphingomonas sanxanigenens]